MSLPCIQGFWVQILSGAPNFQTSFPLIKGSNSKPRRPIAKLSRIKWHWHLGQKRVEKFLNISHGCQIKGQDKLNTKIYSITPFKQ